MFSSGITVLFFILVLFLIFYKWGQLKQMFSIDVTSPANRFQEQLEQTADIVIKRLEEKIIHLESLLNEANEKIINLADKIQAANEILHRENSSSKESLNPLISSAIGSNIETVTNEIAAISINNYKNMGRSDKRSSIIEMADLGYDITEIAKTTGISKGEIMLLLQLNKK